MHQWRAYGLFRFGLICEPKSLPQLHLFFCPLMTLFQLFWLISFFTALPTFSNADESCQPKNDERKRTARVPLFPRMMRGTHKTARNFPPNNYKTTKKIKRLFFQIAPNYPVDTVHLARALLPNTFKNEEYHFQQDNTKKFRIRKDWWIP